MYTALEQVPAAEFEVALKAAGHDIGGFLDAASSRLGFDYDRVLMGRGGVPVISQLLHLSGGKFTDAVHRDKVLFWYVHSALWGRFAGSTETVLQVHHIFPKAALYQAGYDRSLVNAIANFCFLTQGTNLVIGKRLPVPNIAQLIRRILEDGEVSTATKLRVSQGIWSRFAGRSCADRRPRLACRYVSASDAGRSAR